MNQKYKGIIYILCAAFCFALMNAFVRLSGDLPSVQKSFFRNVVAAIFAFIILKKNGMKISHNKENLGLLIARSTFGTIGILCNFYAVDHLVLSDASMLNKMSPFFAIIFSYLFLKERINLVQGIGVIVAFIGSLFIIKPTFSNMALVPSVIGLIGGIGAGAAYTAVRKLGQRGEKGPCIVFFFSSFSCLVTLPYLIFDYHPMSINQFITLLLAGFAAAGGQFAITAAYCCAPAKEISVYDYSQVIFAAIFGFFLFGQVPDGLSILGYILICGMAVLMFLYNTGKLKMFRGNREK
ncbi:DMT family transporter [Cellulosilyticum ruminicola]|uniref:DMT family transporter n=1 Tax=Cellulosilyticum ruminicola TaxID=425254 RepID=UPI0006D1C453|nr:DMT family transporter [Cellulosilyticum ruminicola]